MTWYHWLLAGFVAWLFFAAGYLLRVLQEPLPWRPPSPSVSPKGPPFLDAAE
jgi:hypothetical protein